MQSSTPSSTASHNVHRSGGVVSSSPTHVRTALEQVQQLQTYHMCVLLLLLLFGVRESVIESCVSMLCWKLIPSLNRNKSCLPRAHSSTTQQRHQHPSSHAHTTFGHSSGTSTQAPIRTQQSHTAAAPAPKLPRAHSSSSSSSSTQQRHQRPSSHAHTTVAQLRLLWT